MTIPDTTVQSTADDGSPQSNGTNGQHREVEVQQRHRVVIRFAGDSGDGMQLTGDRFTSEAAAFGNDLATQPNFPAEIRAPQGTLPGVSSFQLHFADYDILTPGDQPDVLVAQLKGDEAIAEADTLLLTVPNQLGVDYNAHVIEAILKHVAPGLGWRRAD